MGNEAMPKVVGAEPFEGFEVVQLSLAKPFFFLLHGSGRGTIENIPGSCFGLMYAHGLSVSVSTISFGLYIPSAGADQFQKEELWGTLVVSAPYR